MKLVLKVVEIEKDQQGGFEFTCEDRFHTTYYFNSKCFKPVDTYILVNVNSFYEYYTATQYQLNVSYIEELQVINNRLFNRKRQQVKSDYIEAVLKEHIGLKGTLKDMESKLQDCYRASISIEDYKQEIANKKLIKKLESKIKEYKRYYNVKG